MVHVTTKNSNPFSSEVLRRNAGGSSSTEPCCKVLESLGRVIAKHPRYAEKRLSRADL